MPIGIVKEFRHLYDVKFEPATRRGLPNSRVKIPCFEGETGFVGSYIVVNFGGEKHPKIWAANCVKPDDKSIYHGSIQINPDLLKEKPELIKMALAEEWVEVMVGLRDKGSGRMQKLVDDKLDLIVLFNSLKQRGAWQDSTDQQIALHTTLRELLVPEDSLHRMAAECSLTLKGIHTEIAVSPNDAMKNIGRFVKAYALKHCVEIELVYDRLMAVLGL